MAIQLQLRKGTKIQNDAFTGAEGELTYDTTTKTVRVHDGATQGGVGFVDLVVDFQAPTAANNYTWYRKYKSGWVEQGGCYDSSNTTVINAYKNTVTWAIPFADTRYTVTAIGCSADDSAYAQDGVSESATSPRTATTFTVAHESVVTQFNLMACGMAAE